MARKSGSKRTALYKMMAEGEAKVPGPSPDPRTNFVLADIVLRGASAALRRRIERRMLAGYGRGKAKEIVHGRTLGETVFNTIIVKLAMRSVPGAVLVSVGMLGKTLLDRSRNRTRAKADGEKAIEDMAENA
jgi:hypothetical protein